MKLSDIFGETNSSLKYAPVNKKSNIEMYTETLDTSNVYEFSAYLPPNFNSSQTLPIVIFYENFINTDSLPSSYIHTDVSNIYKYRKTYSYAQIQGLIFSISLSFDSSNSSNLQ